MDIFRFTNPSEPTKMEQGEIVSGIRSKLWVERYGQAGECTFTGYVSDGLRDALPIGCFISHINTPEIMRIENHEISDSEGQEATITITGRGFETFMEKRIIGSNKTYPYFGEVNDYAIGADVVWNQIIHLVNEHVAYASHNYALPYISIISSITRSGDSIQRSLQDKDLYTNVIKLLAVENLGLRVIRPGALSPFGIDSSDIAMIIHEGEDRSDSVIFSYEAGELISADYLWSDKTFANSAIVRTRWMEVLVDTAPPWTPNYDRKAIFVDGSDIDSTFDTMPEGADATHVEYLAQVRGFEVLSQSNKTAITKAEISHNKVDAVYRRDYNVGDIVLVSGDYNEITKMRIGEYVEAEDENGETSYPTLTIEF